MKDIINEFETHLKKEDAMFIDITWEKAKDSYKLIYTIQGLTAIDYFFPNAKFIFWFDENKENPKNIITYLKSLNCEYNSEYIDDIYHQYENILHILKKDTYTNSLSEFVLYGVEKFNKLNNENQIINIKYNPPGVASCIKTKYECILETIDDEYIIKIEIVNDKIYLYYDFNKYDINIFDDIYIKILDLII